MTVQILESDYDKHSHVCSKYIQPGLDPPCGMRVLNVIATPTLSAEEEEEEAQPADLSR